MVTFRNFDELAVGETASFKKKITEKDIRLFARLTGDSNPLHLDESYAEKTVFKGRIAHGMLFGGLISAALANKLPGPGYPYLKQTLKFIKPVRIGDTVTVNIELVKKIKQKNIVVLKTTCVNQNGEIVVGGEATTKYVG